MCRRGSLHKKYRNIVIGTSSRSVHVEQVAIVLVIHLSLFQLLPFGTSVGAFPDAELAGKHLVEN